MSNRQPQFQRNYQLDDLIAELVKHLQPIQRQVEEQFTEPEWPVGFIVGNPRTGSSLLLQWMANTEMFSYPTNVMNRFAYSPYIGGLVQNMLFNPEYDIHDELTSRHTSMEFESTLGKSQGPLSPHEFQHFFRNYFPTHDAEYLSPDQLKEVDFTGMVSGLASIEAALHEPFITKGLTLQYNIAATFEALPKSIFFHIKRDPLYVMQSIFSARKKYYGNAETWWSAKPREYAQLKDQDIYHQIAGQVFYTDQAISQQLADIPDDKQLVVQYEDFVHNPAVVYEQIVELYGKNGYAMTDVYQGPDSFTQRNSKRIDSNELEKFVAAHEEISSAV